MKWTHALAAAVLALRPRRLPEAEAGAARADTPATHDRQRCADERPRHRRGRRRSRRDERGTAAGARRAASAQRDVLRVRQQRDHARVRRRRRGARGATSRSTRRRACASKATPTSAARANTTSASASVARRRCAGRCMLQGVHGSAAHDGELRRGAPGGRRLGRSRLCAEPSRRTQLQDRDRA